MRQPDPRQLQLLFDSPAAICQPASNIHVRTVPKIIRTPVADDSVSDSPDAYGGKRRRLKLGLQTVEYLLRRTKRRTVGFLIDDHGLRVTAPRWLTIADIEQAILSKQSWILSRLNERRERPPKPRVHWEDGTILPYLDAGVTLRLALGEHAPAKLNETGRDLVLTVPDYTSEQQVRESVQDWMKKEAHRVFSERIPALEDKMGVTCKSFALSNAIRRWGSCSHDGRIRLNWRLIHFPLQVLDYLIVHELAHLREMNHGPRFWAEIESALPGYEEAQNILRNQAQFVMAIF